MTLRVSEKEAVARGWIARSSKKDKAKSPSSKLSNTGEGTPQYVLYHALKEFAPDIDVAWEKTKLIPNRRFITDMFIAPNLVIEVDGFGFHRSKFAFQKDRVRQNIFAEHGFVVLRYYTGQILNPSHRVNVLEQIVRMHESLSKNLN